MISERSHLARRGCVDPWDFRERRKRKALEEVRSKRGRRRNETLLGFLEETQIQKSPTLPVTTEKTRSAGWGHGGERAHLSNEMGLFT